MGGTLSFCTVPIDMGLSVGAAAAIKAIRNGAAFTPQAAAMDRLSLEFFSKKIKSISFHDQMDSMVYGGKTSNT